MCENLKYIYIKILFIYQHVRFFSKNIFINFHKPRRSIFKLTVLLFPIFNGVSGNVNNELELQSALYKQMNSRNLPSNDLNKILFRLFGHTNCDAQLLQPNTPLKHLKSLSTCLNCRLSISEKGHINGVKELNYESNQTILFYLVKWNF